MSYYKVSIQPNGMVAMNDILGIEAYAPDAHFISMGGQLGETVTFLCSGGVFDRLRPELDRLSQTRIPQTDSLGNPVAGGKTWPAITYQVELVPGARPAITWVHPGSLSAGGSGTQALTAHGSGLVAGTQSQYVFLSNPINASSGAFQPETSVPTSTPPVPVLTLTAVRKGPAGNLIGFNLYPALGAGSVSTVFGVDGSITVSVVPAAGASDSTSIAAQIAGNAVAASIMTAVANVASFQIPATVNPSLSFALGASAAGQSQSVVLLGSQYNNQGIPNGAGMGVAFFDFVGSAGTGRLHLEAVLAGNDQNMVSLTVNLGQVGNSVSVTGKAITVNRTEAVGTGVTITNLVSAINGNASAAALVTASAVGTGGDHMTQNLLKSYLYGGAGELPSATVGGVAATITSYTDTSVGLSANVTGILSAGAASGDELQVAIRANYALIQASIPLNA
jgi:hypothetical protein